MSTLTRRDFLIGAGLAAALTSCGKKPETPKEPTLKQFLQQNIFFQRGSQFTNPYFDARDNVVRSDPEATDAWKSAKPALTQKYGNLDGTIVKRRYSFRELNVADEAFAELRRRVEKPLDAFFIELGIPKPSISFKRFTEKTIVKPEECLEMLVFENLELQYHFHNSRVDIKEHVPVPYNSIAGATANIVNSKFDGKKHTIYREPGPVIVNLSASGDASRDTFDVINAIVSEALHYHVSQRTVQYVQEELNKTCDGAPDAGQRVFNSLMLKWCAREEGAVHAAVSKWLRDKWIPSQTDVTLSELQNSIGIFEKKPRYAQMRHLYDSALSPKQLVEAYWNDPEKLFK